VSLLGGASVSVSVLVAAVVWDHWFGEPPARAHPVVWMGQLIGACERRVRRGSKYAELAQGAAIALAVPLLFAGAAQWLLVRLEAQPWLRFVVAVWLLKSTFAVRALGQAAQAVGRALARGDLAAAREGLRSLCSRDPSALEAEAVAAGAVESVAENASDSIVAPLFFLALFGVPGAIAYRAVNTLDAMIGYHGRQEYVGKTAARLDDLLNLIPARLTAGLLLVAGELGGYDHVRGWRILRRDGGRTESPNAGRPMAAMAGLLGVQLEKAGHYRLGDPERPVGAETVSAACRIVSGAAWIALAVAAVVTLL
jgi:adenosylcobinamide-phosphate synthase